MNQPDLPYHKGRGAQKKTANPYQVLHYEPDEVGESEWGEVPALRTQFWQKLPSRLSAK
jgi:hypothetical protein